MSMKWQIVSFLCFATVAASQNCPVNLMHYPPLARQARIEGVVQVEFDIAPDGSVSNAVAKSGHPILQSGTIKLINDWKFDAAQSTRHEKVEFHYHIKGKEGDKRCAQIRIDLPVVEITEAPPIIMYQNSH